MNTQSQIKNKLAYEQIKQVQELYSTGKWSHKQLAEKFEVTIHQIKKSVKGIVKPRPTALERFDAMWTENENGCHIWNGYTSKSGYGQFRMFGKVFHAHRAGYELKIRPLRHGEVVRHKCDNPSCVNVNHLEVGTIQDNNNDKMKRFRVPWQFPSIDYLEMRILYQEGVPLDVISRHFNINVKTLKRRISDMEMTADDPIDDRVFYYRDRAIHEEKI